MRAAEATLATFVLAPADAVRERFLRRFGRVLAPLVGDRDRRIVVSVAILAASALALVLVAPAIPLFVAPLVLGVPHLVADLRYLVVRRGLLSRGAVVLAVLAPSALVFVVSPLEAAAASLVGVSVVANGTLRRRFVVAASALAIVGLHHRVGALADAVFAHGHHLVALVAFAWIAQRRSSTLASLAAVIAIATGILAFTFDPERFAVFGFDRSLAPLASVLAPGATARTAALVLAIYALHQSLHYGVWLRLVPDAVRERSAPRSFASSHRALVDELGSATVIGAVFVTIAFVVMAFTTSVVDARDLYMRAALFHGPLEVALLALAFAESRRP